jgi:hypothetical protein
MLKAAFFIWLKVNPCMFVKRFETSFCERYCLLDSEDEKRGLATANPFQTTRVLVVMFSFMLICVDNIRIITLSKVSKNLNKFFYT